MVVIVILRNSKHNEQIHHAGVESQIFLPKIFQGLKIPSTTQKVIQEIANAGHEFWISFPTI